MKTRTPISHANVSPSYNTYAQLAIMKKINNKINCPITNDYGESLYGDHVDSPPYDDYLESNCGDR